MVGRGDGDAVAEGRLPISGLSGFWFVVHFVGGAGAGRNTQRPSTMYRVTNLVPLVTRVKKVGRIFRELATRGHRAQEEHKRGGDFIRE